MAIFTDDIVGDDGINGEYNQETWELEMEVDGIISVEGEDAMVPRIIGIKDDLFFCTYLECHTCKDWTDAQIARNIEIQELALSEFDVEWDPTISF